jgi:hypothetical protein
VLEGKQKSRGNVYNAAEAQFDLPRLNAMLAGAGHALMEPPINDA